MDKEQAAATESEAIARALAGACEEAMSHYRKAFAAGHCRPGMLTKLMSALNSAGRDDLALEAVTAWVETGLEDPGLLLLHARQLARLERFAEALASLTRLLAAHPGATGLEEFHADLLTHAGRYADAGNVLFRLLRRSFERPELHSFLATLLLRAYPERQADAVLEAAVARDPEDAPAWYHLSELRQRRGRWPEAATAAEACSRLVPGSTLAAGAIARCAILLKDYDKATVIHAAIWDAAAKALSSFQPPAAVKRSDRGPSRTIHPILYLPVEIVGRDFFTRLLVARHALTLGFVAALLPHAAIKGYAAELPPGVILHKSLNALDVDFFAGAQAAGHIVTAVDEEAFGWIGDSRSVMRGTDPRCYAWCDAVFAPGENYVQRIVERHPDARDILIPTGNPRTDILAPDFRGLHEAEVNSARAEHGRHLLLATNFGLWNGAYDAYASICKLALSAPGPLADDDRKWLLEDYKSAQVCEMENMRALTAALGPLAEAFPDHKVVVRPHPVENPRTWQHITEGMRNVVVDARYSFPPHALAADAVIHLDGCGTGLEAMLLERPTVCLAPVDGLLDPSLGLASRLSPRARDAAGLIALLQKVLLGSRPPLLPEQDALMATHLTRPPEGVAAQIARHLDALFRARGPHASAQGAKDVVPALRAALETAGRKLKHFDLRAAHTFQVKRIGLDEGRIAATLDTLGACLGAVDRAEVERAADGCFIIR